MAHGHPRGQIIVETLIVVSLVVTILLVIGTQLTVSKKHFEKNDLTKESPRETQRIYRKK